MNESETDIRSPQTLSSAGQLDAICDQFEAEWKAGQRPQISEWLSRVAETLRVGLFRELLALELAYSRIAGEIPTRDACRLRYPGYVDQVDEAFGQASAAIDATSDYSTDAGLLARARRLDEEAWEQLVSLYGPLVYCWVRRSHVPEADAPDVVQEVFAAVAAHLAAFRHDRPAGTFRGWLWTIARNKIRDHFRHLDAASQACGGTSGQQRLAELPERPPEQEPSVPDARDLWMHRALDGVRASVEPRTWQAFWLLVVERRRVADVQEDLAMSVRAVYEAKYRVLRRIRQEFHGLLELDG